MNKSLFFRGVAIIAVATIDGILAITNHNPLFSVIGMLAYALGLIFGMIFIGKSFDANS